METIWKSPKIKPKDNQKVKFKPKNSEKIYEGLFIEQEDMFFVGFENQSQNFYFSQFIEKWTDFEESIYQDLEYYRKNAENYFINTPISVLQYVRKMEIIIQNQKQ